MDPIRHAVPLLAALLLAACGGQQEAERNAAQAEAERAQAAAVPSNQPTVKGLVSAGEITQLPKGIVLRTRLLDVTDPATPPVTIAETTTETRRLPAEFALPYDPAKIDAARTYVVQAELLTEGVTLYSTPNPLPVLTQGSPAGADLVLVRGSGPDTSISVSEQFRREFDQYVNLRPVKHGGMTMVPLTRRAGGRVRPARQVTVSSVRARSGEGGVVGAGR